MAVKEKTYILDMKGGSQKKVTIPADWKVTFGPLVPGSKAAHGGDQRPALRVYETKEKQRAVFTDVVAFRDSDIPIEIKVTKTQQKRVRKDTPEGERDVVVEARFTEWRDPDAEYEPDDDFLSIEHHDG